MSHAFESAKQRVFHGVRVSRFIALLALFLGAAAFGLTVRASVELPTIVDRVSDYGNIIAPDVEGELNVELSQLQAETGAQLAVVTVPSLQGYEVGDFAQRVFDAWKLGGEKQDDGALLLIALDERKMAIRVGYGLESNLTDVASKRIIDGIITPRFREGNFDAGVRDGVHAITRVIRGAGLPAPTKPDSSGGAHGGLALLLLFVLVQFAFALVAAGPTSKVAWLTSSPFVFLGANAVSSLPVPLIALGAWLIGIPLLWMVLPRSLFKNRVHRMSSSRGQWTVGPGWGSSGGLSGGSWGGGGGGGFHGGGGQSGGGGASGGW